MAVTKSKFGHTIDLVTITTKSGKSVQVAAQAAPNIKGFLDDLEATGYKIGSLGGFSDRANVNNPKEPSKHSYGLSIDINPATNKNKQSTTDMPVEKVQALIKKWGLGWGLNWKSVKDPMHFSATKNEGGWIDPKTMQGTAPTPSGDTIAQTTQVPTLTPTMTAPISQPIMEVPKSPLSDLFGSSPVTVLQGATGLAVPETKTQNDMFSSIANMNLSGGLESVFAEAAKAISSAKDSIESRPMIQSTNPIKAELSSLFDSIEV